MTRALPPHPHLDHLRRQARELQRALRTGEPAALARAAPYRPGPRPALSFAQLVLAREHGFASWPRLVDEVRRRQAQAQPEAEYLSELLALALGRGWHAPQPVQAAARLADRRPRSLALALVTGDLPAVQAGLAGADLSAPLPPWPAPPLAYAAFSSLARLPAYRDGLVATVDWLLQAGADPNTALHDPDGGGEPLPALYGAVARAACLETVQRLLAAGAEPNDRESLYHATEQADRGIVAALVAAGARWDGTNALFHQLDRDDLPALRQCLALGADVNEAAPGGGNALHHALKRGRGLVFVQALLEAGADPAATDEGGHTPAHWAAATGDRETLDWLVAQGHGLALTSHQVFLAACAAGDEPAARAHLAAHPDAVRRLAPHEQRLLPDQAQRGRLAAVKLMLELGWPVAVKGDWDASALNQAAFRGDAAMVRLLLAHGARWDEPNGFGGDAMGSCRFAQANQPDPKGDYDTVAALLVAAGAPA